jgi:hypothetical protein
LTFSREPFAGSYRLSTPTQGIFSGTAGDIFSVVSGIFTSTDFIGLTLNQPVVFTLIDQAVTGYEIGPIYYVKTITPPFQFGLSITPGGALITSTSTGNEFQFEVPARQTTPISATASAADVQAALQALDTIQTGGVIVTGIPGEYFDITFSGAKGYADQPELTIQNGTTAKPGKTADVNFATFALRDLLGNNPAVDLDLELELTESGTRQTVILQACSVAEELIDADSFSPVPQFNLPINTVATTSYTLAQSDAFGLINATTGMTITVPPFSTAAFPTGSQVLIYRSAISAVAITAGSGVTINAPGGADEVASQYSIATLLKLGTNEWVLGGDIV